MLEALTQAADQLRARSASRRPRFNLGAVLFGPQLAFVSDKAPFRTAVCSRRAGKSVGCAAALLDSALRRPGSISLYIALTRVNGKRILWRTLKGLNTEYELGGVANESELCISFPNGSQVYIAGAKDKSEIEKYRGLALGCVVLDEAQSFPAHIEELVDDVLEPALMDHDGTMTLIGTPAPVPVGYFYSCSTNPEWSHHAWTVHQNPWIERKSGKTPHQHLEQALKRRGVTVDDPGIRREWFGEWVFDPNSLVFRYEPSRNTFDALPILLQPWSYVVGVDLGWDDADAIAVLAFNEQSPNAYLVEEWTGTKQTITQLAERLQAIIGKYDPHALVMDTGGLGKKVAEEIRVRTAIPIKAAEKQRKFEFIELLNDALRTGRFLVRADSRFAHDAMLVEWDRDKSKNDRLVVSDRYHSDILDASLYAFRESLHWLHQPSIPEPKPHTPEWYVRESERMEAWSEDELRKRQEILEQGGTNDPDNWEVWAQ